MDDVLLLVLSSILLYYLSSFIEPESDLLV